MKKVLKIVLSIIVALVLASSLYLAHMINSMVTDPVSQEETLVNEKKFLDKYQIDLEDFNKRYKEKEETVKNSVEDYNFNISTYNMKDGKDLFVLIHGMGGTGATMAPIAQIFMDRGYSTIFYDQRNAGHHPMKDSAFGAKEKDDLVSTIAYIKDKYPDKKINIFGESYGANTFLLAYPQIKDYINLIVLDSPMSSGEKMLESVFKISEEQSGMPLSMIKFLGNLGFKIWEGITYKDTNGIDKIDLIDRPILIITSKDDEVVDYSQAEAIFDKSGVDRQMILSKSDHADMYFNENDRYKKVINEFLDKYE